MLLQIRSATWFLPTYIYNPCFNVKVKEICQLTQLKRKLVPTCELYEKNVEVNEHLLGDVSHDITWGYMAKAVTTSLTIQYQKCPYQPDGASELTRHFLAANRCTISTEASSTLLNIVALK